MRRLLTVIVGTALALVLSLPASAQVGAIFALRSGERVSGSLVDMNASGLTANTGGQSRTFGLGDVAVIDFTGGPGYPSNEVNESGGEHLLVLRSGEILRGTLTDVGGTAPLRISFSTGGSIRDFSSNDVARIYLARPSGNIVSGTGNTTSDGLAPATGRVRVGGQAGWVNTGVSVAQGQTLLFNSTGEVRLSSNIDDVAGPSGSKQGRHAPNSPMPSVLAGALIGRIGNGAPFAIGNQTTVPAPGTGVLYLAVNDDGLGDNAGAFGVEVTAQGRRR